MSIFDRKVQHQLESMYKAGEPLETPSITIADGVYFIVSPEFDPDIEKNPFHLTGGNTNNIPGWPNAVLKHMENDGFTPRVFTVIVNLLSGHPMSPVWRPQFNIIIHRDKKGICRRAACYGPVEHGNLHEKHLRDFHSHLKRMPDEYTRVVVSHDMGCR
jgi:hypothetical protein